VALALTGMGCSDNLTPAVDRDLYDGGGVQPLPCVPNLDGRIDASELQAALGIPARYLVSPKGETRTVDLVGTVDAAGRRTWDWAAEIPSDQLAVLTATPLAGKWYAQSFPTGEFVAPLDLAGTTEGVYRHTDEALWLLGYASATENPPEGKTLVVYQQPVALYRFPLEVGKEWVSVGVVQNATVLGIPYAGRDTYEVKVVAAGTLHLPAFSFTQAMKVHTKVSVEPAVGVGFSHRQVSFMFECFGEVARAQSQFNEPEADFTTAVEMRRLGM